MSTQQHSSTVSYIPVNPRPLPLLMKWRDIILWNCDGLNWGRNEVEEFLYRYDIDTAILTANRALKRHRYASSTPDTVIIIFLFDISKVYLMKYFFLTSTAYKIIYKILLLTVTIFLIEIWISNVDNSKSSE